MISSVSDVNNQFQHSLEPVDLQLEKQLLQEVVATEWPAYGKVEISHEEISLDGIVSSITMVAEGRFTKARILSDDYTRHGIAHYLPIALSTPTERKYVLSPLIEVNRNGNLGLDGIHRCLAAFNAGEKSVLAALIKPEHDDIPFVGSICTLKDVSVSSSQEAHEPLYVGSGNVRVAQYFRPGNRIIEQAIDRLTGTKI